MREGVAGEDALQPGIPVELLLRGPGITGAEAPAPVLRRRGQRRLEVGVVLGRPVLAPHLGVHGVLGHLDQAHGRLSGLLLALEDVGEEREQEHGEPGHAEKTQHDEPPAASRRRAIGHVASSSWLIRLSRRHCGRPRRDSACSRWSRARIPAPRGRGRGPRDTARSCPAPSGGRAGDLDRLLEVLQRERRRVAEPVLGLSHPLREASVRQVALDARGHVAVAALEPASYCSFMTWQFTQARGSVER